MATQDELFHEDFRDAIKHLVKALGGVEVVGLQLWPSKSMKAAGSWLSDCLNTERNAKLDIEEVVAVLALGRQEGIHCALHKLCDDLNYQRPDIRAPKTARQILAEKRLRLAEQQKALADEEAALEREEFSVVRGGR